MLCFVGADWPLIGGEFTVNGVRVLWPKKVASIVSRAGSIDASGARVIYETLARSFVEA